MRCEDKLAGGAFSRRRGRGVASVVVRLEVGVHVPPTLVLFRSPGEERHCPSTCVLGCGMCPERFLRGIRWRGVEAHNPCELGTA